MDRPPVLMAAPNLPLMIFGALIVLVRTLLGLALVAGLGAVRTTSMPSIRRR